MTVGQSPVRLAQADLESIIERALDEARSRGASQAEAAVSQDTGLSVGVRLGEVETLEHQRDRSMGITVYFGQRKGSASTADFSPDAVRATVAKACSIARFTAEDSCSGLADAGLDDSIAPRSRFVASVERIRGPSDRDSQIMRSGRPGVRSAHQQLRRCLCGDASGIACVRQYSWLRRRLSHDLAFHQLRGPGRKRRGHAARLLVQQFARLAASSTTPRASAGKVRGAPLRV